MKAAVLGIGTELVDGQIVNKNGAWISAQLKTLGLTTNLHLVVPDEKNLILEALDFCASHCDLLFVTGGLGPTTDDFTRDMISEWTQKPLKFDEASWQQIKERLEPRGYVVKDVQRQQCYFPEDARILKNTEGTANAFFMENPKLKIFVLPGPPREIEAVWKSFIADWLSENTKDLDPYVTRSWDTMGVGESDVAVIVEEVLKGVDIEKGYRVHLPYVEVKISFCKSQEQKFAPYIDKITAALSHCLVTRDQQDIPKMLTEALRPYQSVNFIDTVTGQFLMNRLTPVTREFMGQKSWSFSNQSPEEFTEFAPTTQVSLSLEKRDEHSCLVSLRKGGQKLTDIIETPYKTTLMRERRLQYFAEVAMIFWLKNL